MKPLIFAAALATAVALTGPAFADGQQPSDEARARAAQDEAAGLPDLTKINRPGAEVSSKVEFDDITRTPSFHEKSVSGTEVTEYRDRGKPVEIDVRSNFGTRYQMSSTPDISPRPHQGNVPVTRVPSINLHY
ncbi:MULTISPECIES: hypothetical protein [Burkholderia]|jgi:hypothetical protein|uniref:DUF2782 domain-containing protein n=2 Tax=Burkholderia gladioli TaxID=28095 RepID=A0A095W2B6_BURGA|nr:MULTISPECIES: hypothetical protein [Burkholderia]AEA64576.1 hypothetical protein bgla_2g21420 [Burkholderia gladioli BSR3]AJW94978.1 hypothetical protein BM43_5815 [Burkholderia gladioli]ASD84323.1 hypothetical protein CEJ98_36695 [Burkholderia gladioli pv. gladioli]ATF88318.1 hypothetical protein CO712_25125 [Burkholderia gladioli pv. gladioli]AWY51748.1 hypothetical protein A8H28_11460 [Burkholderia gladioli pv. gladioli]